MNDRNRNFLSPEGRARKEMILHRLQTAAVRRRQARTAARATLALSLAAAAAFLLDARWKSDRPPAVSGQPSTVPDRREAGADQGWIAFITDEQLQHHLARAGLPSGLVRIDGKLFAEAELRATAKTRTRN